MQLIVIEKQPALSEVKTFLCCRCSNKNKQKMQRNISLLSKQVPLIQTTTQIKVKTSKASPYYSNGLKI